MLTSTKKVYEEILELPISERAELSDKLLMDLTPTSNSIDKAWMHESERRLKEYHDGKVEAIPGKQVFDNIYKRFGK